MGLAGIKPRFELMLADLRFEQTKCSLPDLGYGHWHMLASPESVDVPILREVRRILCGQSINWTLFLRIALDMIYTIAVDV